MNLQELKFRLPASVAPLAYCMHGFPHESLAALREAGEEGDRLMLAALRHAADHPEDVQNEYGWVLRIIAAYHLAERRSTEAYALLLRSMVLPQELLDDIWSDCIGECLPAWLVSTWDGDLARLIDFILDQRISVWARHGAVDTLAGLYHGGRVGREPFLDAMRTLDRELGEPDDPVRAAWMLQVGVTGLAELADAARRSIAGQRGPTVFISLDEFERDLRNGVQGTVKTRDIDSPVEPGWEHTLPAWHMYERKAHRRYFGDPAEDAEDVTYDEEFGVDADGTLDAPYVRPAPKVGRNDPCPCGSGKKYKKCCIGVF